MDSGSVDLSLIGAPIARRKVAPFPDAQNYLERSFYVNGSDEGLRAFLVMRRGGS
jgi:hypothetical protein